MRSCSAIRNGAMTIFGCLQNCKKISKIDRNSQRTLEKEHDANNRMLFSTTNNDEKTIKNVITQDPLSHVSWLDKFTDESNTWLNALKTEEIGDPKAACDLYLHDAQIQLANGATLHAGLSYFCAAECMRKLGENNDAQILYAESADLYLANFEKCVRYSIAEAIWTLRRAYHSFILANDIDKAEKTRSLLDFLISRTMPFNDEDYCLYSKDEFSKNEDNKINAISSKCTSRFDERSPDIVMDCKRK